MASSSASSSPSPSPCSSANGSHPPDVLVGQIPWFNFASESRSSVSIPPSLLGLRCYESEDEYFRRRCRSLSRTASDPPPPLSPDFTAIAKPAVANNKLDVTETKPGLGNNNKRDAARRKPGLANNNKPDVATTTKPVGAKTATLAEEEEEEEEDGGWPLNHDHFQLALYIAMAHAGLVLVAVVLYGLCKLLQDYWEPIQWAVLCSMPLREIQLAAVEFWEPPLRKGLLATLFALPNAFFKALFGTLLDARIAIYSLLARKPPHGNVRFSTLMQWLVSFAFFTLGFEFLGPATLALSGFLGMILYAVGVHLGLVVPVSGHLRMQPNWSILSRKQTHRSIELVLSPMLNAFDSINKKLTRGFINHLHTIIAICLISIILVGSLSGLVFFSYKVGFEGKDAVLALKSHVQNSNYAERIGLKQLVDEYKVPELIDSYSSKALETISNQIDVFATQYNLTELVNASKKYIIGIAQGGENHNANASDVLMASFLPTAALERLGNARLKLRDYDVKGIYSELELATSILLEHFHMSREDLIEKVKQLGQRWVDVGKQILASSSMVMTTSIYLLLSICSSIASGAAGLFHYFTQAMLFSSLLYYLITSKPGGVMAHVLAMVPLSATTRSRCATVLDYTVTSVLLGTAKAAFFQAVFTWLLFRFFNIHFLYMSTFMAFFTAVLPIFPCWASSLLAGVQLAFEGRYVQAVCLMVTHIWVMDYGVSSIQRSIPGHNAYFTGLSIAGGMAVFTPALEGAIMGPLLMTVIISVKNLYSEFVLAPAKGEDYKELDPI